MLCKQLKEKDKVITSKNKLLAQKEKEIAELKECEDALKRLFNEDQIRLLKKRLSFVRYSLETIQDSISIFLHGGTTAYNFLRDCKGFPLPHLRTLRNYLRLVVFKPGALLSSSLDLMEMAGKNMAPEDKICGIHIDEMAISPREELSKTHGMLNGLPTLKLGKNLEKSLAPDEKVLAVKAQNILVAGWRKRWVQPVAYDFTANSFDTQDFVENRLKPTIRELRAKGFRPISVTFDEGPENLAV